MGKKQESLLSKLKDIYHNTTENILGDTHYNKEVLGENPVLDLSSPIQNVKEKCPYCFTHSLKKNGKKNNLQSYKCNKCNKYSREDSKGNIGAIKEKVKKSNALFPSFTKNKSVKPKKEEAMNIKEVINKKENTVCNNEILLDKLENITKRFLDECSNKLVEYSNRIDILEEKIKNVKMVTRKELFKGKIIYNRQDAAKYLNITHDQICKVSANELPFQLIDNQAFYIIHDLKKYYKKLKNRI